LAAVCAGVAVLLAIVSIRHSFPTEQKLLLEARNSLQTGDFASARHLTDRILARSPDSQPALILAAQATAGLGHVDEAVKLFERIATGGGDDATEALVVAGELLLHHGRACEAEQFFRCVLQADLEHPRANSQLGYLLTVEGRAWEAKPHVMHALKSEAYPLEHLIWFARPDAMLNDKTEAVLRRWLDAMPGDLVPLTGLAKLALRDNDQTRADKLLRQIVSALPQQAEAQAMLGSLLLEAGQMRDFEEWRRSLPEEAFAHPDIWAVLGRSASRNDQPCAAARCYFESIRRDPNQSQANYQLSRLLNGLGDSKLAERFGQRAELLAELRITVELINDNKQNAAMLLKAAELCEKLGRYWEALGWYHFARAVNPRFEQVGPTMDRLASRLSRNSPQTIESASPIHLVDLSKYPMPEWRDQQTEVSRDSSRVAGDTTFRFVNVADEAGVRFQYYNDHDPSKVVMRMIEATGGGAAALDYDGDGWSDIYLTQGCVWPKRNNAPRHVDRLYRNMGNGTFCDVTNSMGVAEEGYSQGVSIGDYDSDGFPDLYVANFGANRFYRNNGDGTFTDVTPLTGTAGNDWTSSCALADLSGDGLPDLYAVNYLAGEDVDSRICKDSEGVLRSCMPNLFPAAQDRMYLNLGDGRFEEQTQASGIVADDGRGLGVIVADFENTGILNVFVGNDAEPNFYLVNETRPQSGQLSFSEQAMISGLAFNHDGKPQACMGIAAGDVLNDGLLDLFITNYYADANTLYRQLDKGLFQDGTREAGLHDPSFHKLGYGTCFLDADLDGRIDLIVANGHEGNYTDLGIPYEMEPQFFQNMGNGRFADQTPRTAGEYFHEKYVARGLARLDWNRDGREDFVVSHLDRPVALVLNETPPVGNYLTVHLRGVQSNRDAIGARVTVVAGEQVLTRQLIAGDGYMASNERLLLFALGKHETIDKLTVVWPSGGVQGFHGLPANREVVLLEGFSEPVFREK